MKALHINTEIDEREVSSIWIKGDIDKNTSPIVSELLNSLFNKSKSVIVVDLAEVNYIDSSGIATLVEGLRWCNRSKKKFRLACLTPEVKEAFKIDHLLSAFEVFDSSEDALKESL
jgi:anti-sigma B factor antagonist